MHKLMNCCTAGKLLEEVRATFGASSLLFPISSKSLNVYERLLSNERT